MTRHILTFFAALAFMGQLAFAQLAVTPLSIKSGETVHKFTVEIADTPDSIREGLMFRESLAPDAGMLFDFGEVRPAAMWMKNTLIPLDMLFMDADGEVIAIARNAVPGSLRSLGPGVPVRAVLEIPGGRAKELGINPGDKVTHPIFGSAGG
ncbi:DUF192 domain-containing protein [Hyphomonas sp.]|uniref:DUF192 domain-containing protein n=1 Tax=Hyphomonas sp. TaxID=87 RepID=UPI0025BDE538|nr:DUF192 domain-containing protein [Hyphomonas sp.]MBI1401121.1 DUF192 domain-containing protein [Hyphomonas sp.]